MASFIVHQNAPRDGQGRLTHVRNRALQMRRSHSQIGEVFPGCQLPAHHACFKRMVRNLLQPHVMRIIRTLHPSSKEHCSKASFQARARREACR